MDIFLSLVILSVLAVAIISGQVKNSSPKTTPEMITPTTNQSSTNGQSTNATISGKSLTPTPVSSPTVFPSPSPTPQPAKSPVVNNLSSWRYPNTTVTSEQNNSLRLTSNDNPDIITNWYKEKIKSSGATTKSFVTTKANDKILNKLVGASGNQEILIEIKKDPGASPVQILVEIKSS